VIARLDGAAMTGFTQAIVRRPGHSAVSGLRAHGGPDPTFAGLAAEHTAYVAALAAAGLAVTALDPLEHFPDALFVEDPALVFPEAAVLLRPGAPSREGEVALLRPALAAAFPQVIDLPAGYADGGDVMALPGDVLIGLSARTDRTGAAALAKVLSALGRPARIVETPPSVLHLKTASSIIDDETVLATAELAATGIFAEYRVLIVPPEEERGANVLRANAVILVGNRFPRIAALLDGHGGAVQLLETAEIEKIDAGFTCMSLRW
jgi:dimethylargininase